jgi:hypothetical protein
LKVNNLLQFNIYTLLQLEKNCRFLKHFYTFTKAFLIELVVAVALVVEVVAEPAV